MAYQLAVCLFLVYSALEMLAADEACVDVIANCRSYGRQTCVDYVDWAKINCPYTCQFCKGPAPQRQCKDLVNSCHDYVEDMCTNEDYKSWAEDNCPSYCGFCGTANTAPTTQSSHPPTITSAPNCDNLLGFCPVYSHLACGDTTWADTYCRKYCNRC